MSNWGVDEEMFEEWDRGETLTEEEKKSVEDEVNRCYFEELKEENEKLKDQVEEVTRRAEEEVKKRVKAEGEAKREKEMVDKLIKILMKKSSVGTEERKEETEGRRAESRNLGRPSRCYPEVGEVARVEASIQQQEQGFLQPPAMVRGVRYTMVGGQKEMLMRRQQEVLMRKQQQEMMMRRQQQQIMTRQQQEMVMWRQQRQSVMKSQQMMVNPMVVMTYGAWGAPHHQ